MRTRNKARRATACRAFTLLEVMAAMVFLAAILLMVVPRFGHDTIANLRAHGFTRRLALDLVQAKRRSVGSGDNHFVRFTLTGGSATDYAVFRSTGSGDVQVESTRVVPADVTVIPGVAQCEFTFDGSALASYEINIDSPDHAWLVSVIAATGAVNTVP